MSTATSGEAAAQQQQRSVGVAQAWSAAEQHSGGHVGNNGKRSNGLWADDGSQPDEASLIISSADDGESAEQTFSPSRNKKRVTFVADERLVSVRSISPRSSTSPVEFGASDVADAAADYFEDDRAAAALVEAPALAARSAARRNSRLVYNKLLAANSARLSTLCVDTAQHQPRPPSQPPSGQQQPRCVSADASGRPDSAAGGSSSFAVTKRRIDRYINATRPLTASGYRRKAAIAAAAAAAAAAAGSSSGPLRCHKPRQLIEINMKGLNSGSLLLRPVLAKSCPDLVKTVAGETTTTSITNGRVAQPSERWGRQTPTRPAGGSDKAKVYAWHMANGSSSAVMTPSIVPLYNSGVVSGRPYSAT